MNVRTLVSPVQTTQPASMVQARPANRFPLVALYASNGLTLSGLRLQTMIFAWIALGAAGQGWVGMINGLPVVAACLLAAWGGLLADSPSAHSALVLARRVLMAVAALGAALALLGLTSLPVLLVLSMALAGLTALDTPIARSLLFHAAGGRPLLKVTSTNSLVLNALNVGGPAAIGLILESHGGGIALLCLAGIYFVAALFSQAVVAPSREPAPRKQLLSELTAGIAHLRTDAQLAWLVSLVLIVPLAGTFFAIVPLYARDVLQTGPAGFGLLMACYGFGNLAGSAYFAAGNKVERRGMAILALGAAYGAGMIAFGCLSSFVACAAVAATMGAIAMLWQNLLSSTIQQQAPAAVQGRVMSLYTMGIQLLPLGWLISAGISLVVDARIGLVLAGLAAISLNLVAGHRSKLLSLR